MSLIDYKLYKKKFEYENYILIKKIGCIETRKVTVKILLLSVGFIM